MGVPPYNVVREAQHLRGVRILELADAGDVRAGADARFQRRRIVVSTMVQVEGPRRSA